MTAGHVSLIALFAAIVVSCFSRVNVGLVAFALAWGVGLVAGGGAELVVKSFPSQLFVTLCGVTLLFALAEVNGTIDGLAHAAFRLARGDARRIPPILFAVACVISSVGPGAIPSVALLAPMAMAVGLRAGIPPFLIALAVTNGANAGNLSAFSAVGVVANSKMAEAGLGGHEVKVWAANFAAHLLVAAAAYFGLGGWRLSGESAVAASPEDRRFTGRQWLTIGSIAVWIAGVVVFGLPLGLAGFSVAIVLILAGAADESAALKRMPWAAVMMVTGMSVLVGVVEKTGGMTLFTSLLAAASSPATINGMIAFVTGLISIYSSTSGVVLPTFLPMVPGLVRELGGGEPLAVALSINVGASLVDVSPLSTLGALCVAAVADAGAAKSLFRRLMAWGLSMAVVGALLCQLLAGPFSRL
jgi:di/tricarboxylate transporter